jgi:hypothetical protein
MDPHVQAVFEQFPWLQQHFCKQRFWKAKVSRMDTDFLGQRLEYQWTGTMPEISYRRQIFLYDEHGNPLSTLDENKWYRRIQHRFSNECVQDVLQKLGSDADRCTYAVSILGRTITVMRPPKTGTVMGLLRHKQEAEFQVLEKAREEISDT